MTVKFYPVPDHLRDSEAMAPSMIAEIDSQRELPSVSSGHVGFSQLQGAPSPSQRPTSIRVPDMFSSILSAKAIVNPHYLAVKEDGDRYIGEYVLQVGPEFQHRSIAKLDRPVCTSAGTVLMCEISKSVLWDGTNTFAKKTPEPTLHSWWRCGRPKPTQSLCGLCWTGVTGSSSSTIVRLCSRNCLYLNRC